jgi:hypothetical protein
LIHAIALKGEEKFVFPRFSKDIPEMNVNLEQHHIIHEFLHSLEVFVEECTKASDATVIGWKSGYRSPLTVFRLQDSAVYSAEKICKILDKYTGEFHGHLSHEVMQSKLPLIRSKNNDCCIEAHHVSS